MQLDEGLEASVEDVVTEEMTATAVGSGDVRVLATPVVLSLVERAAVKTVRGRLPDGQTSVGSSVTLDHLAPTPVGARVKAAVRLAGVDGRRVTFSFSVGDPAGEVARGTHVRVIVDRERFESGAGERAG
jgi:fluoroacetyl-CoA thioesterase